MFRIISMRNKFTCVNNYREECEISRSIWQLPTIMQKYIYCRLHLFQSILGRLNTQHSELRIYNFFLIKFYSF